METPDKSIPQDLLDKAHCIVIVPGLKKVPLLSPVNTKGIFVLPKEERLGLVCPRHCAHRGGSFGLQIGGSETDVIMLVMNERERIVGFRVNSPSEARAKSRPGRWVVQRRLKPMPSSGRKFFPGLVRGESLQGLPSRARRCARISTITTQKLKNREIVMEGVRAPEAAATLLSLLTTYSARESK
jgi:lipid-binding SYLF domain-containing protein